MNENYSRCCPASRLDRQTDCQLQLQQTQTNIKTHALRRTLSLPIQSVSHSLCVSKKVLKETPFECFVNKNNRKRTFTSRLSSVSLVMDNRLAYLAPFFYNLSFLKTAVVRSLDHFRNLDKQNRTHRRNFSRTFQ